MLPPAVVIRSVPDLLQIFKGILKIPSKTPVLGPVSISVNPVEASPPCSIPSIVHLLQ